MARARLLKPSFFTNDRLAELPPVGRILFAGLWCIADREGRLEDRPTRIKAEILPYDRANVDALLGGLETAGFIERYESEGHRYIQVLAFAKHQSPHMREPVSTIPAPGEHCAATAFSGTGPAVTPFPFPVTPNPIPDPEAVTVTVGGDDDGFRERYGTLALAFGDPRERRLIDEFEQIANDATLEEIREGIAVVRRAGQKPYPSKVWAAISELRTPAEAAQSLEEFMESMYEPA